MSAEDVCPTCGQGVDIRRYERVAEESLVSSKDRSVHAAQRKFRVICKNCGLVWTTRTGHHSSFSEKRLKEEFSKQAAGRVLAKLSVSDAKAFKASLAGNRMPTPEDLLQWRALAADCPQVNRSAGP